jgi:hypothetical protein
MPVERSHGKPRPPFRAPRIQYCAAGFGFHPHAKAVRALAAGFGWLICALHALSSLEGGKTAYYSAYPPDVSIIFAGARTS